jgi:hypothetical protein
MADTLIPVKAKYTGTDVTSLGEYATSEEIPKLWIDSDLADKTATNSYTATQTFKGITETEATNSTATYTVDLANGTIFDLTSASAVAITMPAEVAGKAFTIIVKTAPASWTSTPAILWASGTVPSATTISIYSFLCDGTTWYGMEAGNGFAAP